MRVGIMLLLALGFCVPHATQPAPAPPVEAQPVDATCAWRLVDGQVVPPDPDAGPSPGQPTFGDLDGDLWPDAVAQVGGCGSWECLHVVLRGCAQDRFEAVWGPEYAYPIEIGVRASNEARARLILRERTGMAGCDAVLRSTLRWDGGGWTTVGEPCVAAVGAWDESCGPLPSPCAE